MIILCPDEYTVSYLSFEKNFEDQCGNTYIAYGNPIITKDPTGKFNNCLYLDGQSYLYMDGTIELGGRDCTVDCWMYNMNTPGSFKAAFCVAVSYYNRIATFYTNGNNIMTSTAAFNDQYFTIELEKWYHIAYTYVFEEDVWYTYLDGKCVATVNVHKDRGNFESGIGYDKIHNIWKGYIKNFRISDGIARWKGEDFSLEDILSFDTKRIILKNVELNNDTERRIKTWNNNIYVFVTSDKHKLIESSKTQKQMLSLS